MPGRQSLCLHTLTQTSSYLNIHAGGDSTPIKLSEIILGPSCILSDVICSEVTPLLCLFTRRLRWSKYEAHKARLFTHIKLMIVSECLCHKSLWQSKHQHRLPHLQCECIHVFILTCFMIVPKLSLTDTHPPISLNGNK